MEQAALVRVFFHICWRAYVVVILRVPDAVAESSELCQATEPPLGNLRSHLPGISVQLARKSQCRWA